MLLNRAMMASLIAKHVGRIAARELLPIEEIHLRVCAVHCKGQSFSGSSFDSDGLKSFYGNKSLSLTPLHLSPLLRVFREIAMGRKKLQMKKIENHAGRLIRYAKRRDGMVKKASELSILCDAEVGLLMFSPTGRLTSFSSSGRIEDIFLRYIGCAADLRGGPVENEENLIQRLVHLNFEHKILDKITKMKDLEEKLQELRHQKLMAQEKMRSYNLNAHSIITSVRDAQALEQTLVEAIQRVEELKEILLNNAVASQVHDATKVLDTNVKGADLYAEAALNASKCRNPSRVEGWESNSIPTFSQLSIDFLKEQRDWNLQRGGHASKA